MTTQTFTDTVDSFALSFQNSLIPFGNAKKHVKQKQDNMKNTLNRDMLRKLKRNQIETLKKFH